MEPTFCSIPINLSQKGTLWDNLDIVNWTSTSNCRPFKDWLSIPPPWASLMDSESIKPRAGLPYSKRKNLIENPIEEGFLKKSALKESLWISFTQRVCQMHLDVLRITSPRTHSSTATGGGQRNLRPAGNRYTTDLWLRQVNPRSKESDFWKWVYIWHRKTAISKG